MTEKSILAVVEALKASKEYVYDIANICKECEHRSHVFRWVRAEDDDIEEVLRELRRSYRLALDKEQRLAEQIEQHGIVSLFGIDEVIRAFRRCHVRDCIHLRMVERKPRLATFYWKEGTTLEGWLRDVRLWLGPFPSKEDVKRCMDELKKIMERTYEELLMKVQQSRRNELVAILVKKDLDGNLRRNEVRLLCKACEESLVNRLEMNPPCEGINCLFKHFVAKFGERIGCRTRYVDVYDFGVLEGKNGNIIVSRGRPNQPTKNVLMFNPKLIVCIQNFFSSKLASKYLTYRSYPTEDPIVRWRRRRKAEERLRDLAFNCAKEFLVPTLAYDCETNQYAYVPVGIIEPSTIKIVEKLASIEYTIGSTEGSDAHDNIAKICENIGLEFGLRPIREYEVGSGRVDVAWLDKDAGALKVAIEVELGTLMITKITNDLWKLCEARPELGVLIVEGDYYKRVLERVAKSEIIKKMGLRLMVLNISEKTYVVVRGGVPLIAERGS